MPIRCQPGHSGGADLHAIAVDRHTLAGVQGVVERALDQRGLVIGHRVAREVEVARVHAVVVEVAGDQDSLRRNGRIHRQRERIGDLALVAARVFHARRVAVGLAVVQTAVLVRPVRALHHRVAQLHAVAVHHHHFARTQRTHHRALQQRRRVVGLAARQVLARLRRKVVDVARDRRRRQRRRHVEVDHVRRALPALDARRAHHDRLVLVRPLVDQPAVLVRPGRARHHRVPSFTSSR